MMFLIKGHTKNECDSKFNSLKKGTYGINTYTEDGLDAAYTKNNEKDIRFTRLHEGETRWKAFSNSFVELYRNLESGQLMKNHIFIFGGENPIKRMLHVRQLYRDMDKI